MARRLISGKTILTATVLGVNKERQASSIHLTTEKGIFSETHWAWKEPGLLDPDALAK
jgi:hypothetical protein